MDPQPYKIAKSLVDGRKVEILGMRGVGKTSFLEKLRAELLRLGAEAEIVRHLGDYVGNGRITLVDDAHIFPQLTLRHASAWTSIKPLSQSFADAITITIHPLNEGDIASLLSAHGIKFEKEVPAILLRETGGLPGYIFPVLAGLFAGGPGSYLSGERTLAVLRSQPVQKTLLWLATGFLRSYIAVYGHKVANILTQIVRGVETDVPEELEKIGLVSRRNGEYCLSDPLIARLLKSNPSQIRGVSVKYVSFSKTYSLGELGYYTLRRGYLIAVIKDPNSELIARLEKIMKVTFSSKCVLITPSDAEIPEEKRRSFTVIKVGGKKFQDAASAEFRRIVSLVERGDEL